MPQLLSERILLVLSLILAAGLASYSLGLIGALIGGPTTGGGGGPACSAGWARPGFAVQLANGTVYIVLSVENGVARILVSDIRAAAPYAEPMRSGFLRVLDSPGALERLASAGRVVAVEAGSGYSVLLGSEAGVAAALEGLLGERVESLVYRGRGVYVGVVPSGWPYASAPLDVWDAWLAGGGLARAYTDCSLGLLVAVRDGVSGVLVVDHRVLPTGSLGVLLSTLQPG